jgi:glycosyltransferase involved in cell wall biosynthesis
MKKILILSLQFHPLIGGAEIAIKEITDRIPHNEIEFHLVTLRFYAESAKEEKIGNIHIYRVGKGKKNFTFSDSFAPKFYIHKILFIPLAALKGISIARKIGIEGIWAMMTYMLFPLVLMRMVGIRTPYILTLQEGDPFEHVFERTRIKLFSPLLFYGIKKAERIQVISNFLGVWARKCGYKGKIEIIPNGVAIKEFGHIYTGEEITSMKDMLGKKEGDIFMVTTSRLVYKNGVDDVIRSLPLLPKEVTFLIYGIGPDEEILRALVKELGVESRVKFNGYISHTEMPLMLKSCDIFIRPSRSEGMGNSFVEAMAAGIPVIATQEGGLTDFLFDEKRNPDKPTTGWAVDTDSSEQIAQAVTEIISNPEKVHTVTEEAKRMVIEKYDWNIVAKDMDTLFQNLVQS